MARERGTFNFSANLEVKKQGALDSRLVVQTYAELTQAATWADTDDKVWLYDGMIVSVVADGTGKNGVYMLTNKDEYSSEENWTRIDAASAEKTEVIDNLTSDSSTAALSARQGKVLKTELDAHTTNSDIHFSAEERLKLEGIEEGAQKNTVTSVAGRQGDVVLTKSDVGLDQVDNTSDANKPVSTAQAAAIKVVQDELTEFKNTKGKADGLASLDENGKIPASQLSGEIGQVVGLEKFLKTEAELSTDPDASTAEEGEKYFCEDVKKIFTKTSSGWDEGEDPKGNTIYNHRLADKEGHTNVLYRWDGTTMVEISASLALGETEGTAYEGSKGKALRGDLDNHISNHENPHQVTKAQVGLDKVENLAPSELPVSTATQTALDLKVDKVEGSSLVEDTEIAKLKGLSDQGTIDAAIADAKKAGTDADAHLTAVSGQSTGAYVANGGSNYISTATSLNDADVKLDAQIKVNADKIAALESSVGEGGSVDDKIEAAVNEAIEGLKGGASAEYDTLKEIEDIVKQEISDRTSGDSALDAKIGTSSDTSAQDTVYGAIKKEEEARTAADQAINDSIGTKSSSTIDATTVWGAIEELETEAGSKTTEIEGDITALEGRMTAVEGKANQNESDIAELEGTVTALDTAVSAFKNKTVSETVSNPGDNTSLPTTKAVVDYVTTATNGVANNMTYTAKGGDPTKMELKLIAVDGSTLSTIELDKENFISNFEKREATAEDHSADPSINEGDPILVVTTVNGQVFRVNLKELVDIYTGQATNSITTTVSGYTISADLKLDSATQDASPVKLTVGSNGLSADLSINASTNGTKGITLTKDGNGLAAELKIDEATNTANGVSMAIGANGVSVGIVWTEL